MTVPTADVYPARERRPRAAEGYDALAARKRECFRAASHPISLSRLSVRRCRVWCSKKTLAVSADSDVAVTV